MVRKTKELILENLHYFLIFLFTGIYLFSSFPVFSSGDGGELVTSSYLFGIAHPPGYPLYIEISKLFSLLPFGNIAQRITLVSIVFSAISLSLVYRISFLITKDRWISLLPLMLLGFTYSFFYNSVVQKFYTISLAVLLLIIYIVVKAVSENNFGVREFSAVSFLLGVAFMVHHSTLLIAVPIAVISAFYYRYILKLKYIPLYVTLFLIPLAINLHMYISSIKNRYYSIVKSENWEEFVHIFLRKNYAIPTDQAVVSGLFSVEGVLNWLQNFIHLLNINYTYAGILLVVAGLVYLWNFNKKVMIFLATVFIMFGPLMTKLTLSSKLTPWNSYVVMNQYFLPFLAVVVILMASGIYFFSRFVSKGIYTVIIVSSYAVAVTLFPATFITTNQSKNWVPYYHVKDILSILPVSSVLFAIGDSYNFGLWYLKLAGRYRDDICHLASYNYASMNFGFWGCSPKNIYSKLIPEMQKGLDLNRLSRRNVLFSTFALSKSSPLYFTFDSKPYLYIYMYFEKDRKENMEDYLRDKSLKALRYLTPEVCTGHGVDDLYTKEMCVTFSNGYMFLASYIKPLFILENYKSRFVMLYTHYYGSEEFSTDIEVYINPENQQYIEQYSRIQKYNDLSRYYLY